MSGPGDPVMRSLPAPPASELAAEVPVSVSFRAPPVAFSTPLPAASVSIRLELTAWPARPRFADTDSVSAPLVPIRYCITFDISRTSTWRTPK